MEALVTPLGIGLPTEARVWWGWHDGTEIDLLSHAIGHDILPLQLAQAVEQYGELLEAASDVTADDENSDPDDFWRREWFPFAVPRRAHLACDCSVAETAPTPIRHVDFYFHAESQVPVSPSLGAVVSLWIDAIDREAWTYDHDRPGWTRHPERLPRLDGRTRLLVAELGE